MHAAFASFTFVTGVIRVRATREPWQRASDPCRQAAGQVSASQRLRFHAYNAFSRGPR
ncbi:hypothetical protein PAMC26510_37260 [Caballeronia sordidicola]|jgi:hypothetical protein|uniref:Uncharacterized protein n=1 Tax=Caballeronia sordidicola TaxID=196367 RepID=A0A242M4D9_CABSO|nr:hypothetical protein PAMC26510_37260 [Caballeronia sordidicola]